MTVRYVTISMLAEHADKHPETVRLALRASKVEMIRPPGCKGFRVSERDANKFLLRQWPGCGPLPALPIQ